MKKIALALILIISTTSFGLAQKEYKIHLNSINKSPLDNVSGRKLNEVLNGYYIVQFNKNISEEEKANLKRVKFLKYVPNYTWIVSINNENSDNLKRNGVRYIEPYSAIHKFNFVSDFNGFKKFIIQSFNPDETKKELLNLTIPFRMNGDLITLSLDKNGFESVMHLESIYFIEEFQGMPKLESPIISRGAQLDGNTQRSNYIGNNAEEGLFFDGSGVEISIKEGGSVNSDDTINYRGRSVFHDLSSSVSSHKTGVAWRAASAGITNPLITGAAPGATIHTSTGVKFGQSNIRIESMSYGWGCATSYNSGASNHDKDVISNQYAIFSYSAGNSGSNDCSNGYGSGWNNITGNHKQAKNIFTVGSVNNNDGVYGFSSRGPAYDGRIKPEIVTSGGGGTSFATPAFAGFWAQLQQAYKYYNGGTESKSDLLKCITLNSADDAGNLGPDYTYGWGRINARKAHEIIKDSSFFTGSISNSETKTHSISVPADIKEMKVMVYWHDPEAASNVSKALVNDVDLLVKNGVTIYQPYALNGTSSANVSDLATKGSDHLNNMEQVVINNPVAGSYSFELSGYSIAQGPQAYTICYYLDNGKPEIVSPLGGNSFENTSSIRIMVDGAEHEAIELFYSTDQAVWQSIGTVAQGNRYLDWTVPSGLNANKVYFKAANSIGEDALVDPVNILNTPSDLSLLSRCANQLTLTWSEIADADKYVVYKLGQKYMEPIDTVNVPQFSYMATDSEVLYFAVASLTNSGAISVKTPAFKASVGVVNCSGVVADFTVSDHIVEIGDTVFLKDLSINGVTNWSWTITSGTISNLNAQNPFVVFTNSGINTVSLTVSNGVSSDQISKLDFITVVPKDNYALKFDGVDEHLKLNETITASNYDEMTLEAWINPGLLNTATHGVFGSTHTQDYYSGFILDIVDNTKIKFGYGPGSWDYRKTTGSVLIPGEWQHVALVFNKSGGYLRLYINGVLQNSITVTDNAWSKNQVYIGRSDDNGGYYNGFIDDIRMWSRSLSSSELGFNYCNQPPNSNGLIFNSNCNIFNQGLVHDTLTNKTATAVNMENSDWQKIENSNCETINYLSFSPISTQWLTCDSIRLNWNTNVTGNATLSLKNGGQAIDSWLIDEVSMNYFSFNIDYLMYDLTDGYSFELTTVNENAHSNSFEIIEGCPLDCNNEYNGLASIDDCGVCSGGSTGISINSSCVDECSDPILVYTSTFQAPNTGDLTLDDNLNTRWSAEGDGEWILYKFPCPRKVENLRIAFFSGDVRTSTFEVTVSSDSLSWISLGEFTSSGISLELEDFLVNSGKTKYLKIIGKGNSVSLWNSYTEVDFEYSLENDCFNELGGLAIIDSCGLCSEGNTGIEAELNPNSCTITSTNNLFETIEVFPTILNSGDEVNIQNYEGLVKLFNANGQLIKLEKNSSSLSTSGVQPGYYFMQIVDKNQVLTRQILIL